MMYPELKSEYGVPPQKCKPFQTVGTVIAIEEETWSKKHLDDKYDYQRTYNTVLTFKFKDEDGKEYTSSQSFRPGELWPKELGGKALGVAYMTQFGFTYQFRLTHVLKEST